MANRFWVGGTGTWDGTAGVKWSTSSGGVGGAAVPTSEDDVFFNHDGNLGFDYTVTIASGNTGCLTLRVNPVETVSVTVNLQAAITISSSLLVSASPILNGQTITSIFNSDHASASITFNSTSSRSVIVSAITSNIDSNLVARIEFGQAPLTFNGVGGNWTFTRIVDTTNGGSASASFTVASGNWTLTNGTFTLSASTEVWCGRFLSNNSNTRVITLDGTINLQSSTTPQWDTTTTTGLTISGTGTIKRGNQNAAFTIEAGSNTVTLPSVEINETNTTTLNNVNCLNLTKSAGTLADTNIKIRGNFTHSGGSYAGTTGTLTFDGTGTITSSGITAPRHFDVMSGTRTLSDSLTLGSSNNFTLTAGTLAIGSLNLTCGAFISSNTNTRAVTGTGAIILPQTGTIWNTSTTSGLTSGSAVAIRVTSVSASARTATFGSNTKDWGALTIEAGTGNLTVTNASVASLNFTGYAGQLQASTFKVRGNLVFSTGMTFGAGPGAITMAGSSTSTITNNGKTINHNLIVNMSSGIALDLIDALNLGTGSLTVTQGNFNSATTKALTVSTFNISGTLTRTVDADAGLTITGSGSVFDANTTTNLTFREPSNIVFSYTGAVSRTADFGAMELLGASITGGTGLFTFGNVTFSNDLNWTGFVGTWVMPTQGLTLDSVTGTRTLTLGAGMLTSGTTGVLTMSPSAATTFNIDSNGVVLSFSVTENDSGTLVILDNFVTQGALTINAGTFNANNFNVTCSKFLSSNASTRTITMGSGTWAITSTAVETVWNLTTITNLTLNANTSTIKLTGSTTNTRTFAGGGLTHNNIWINNPTAAGRVDFTGSNTFSDFRSDTIAQQIRFTSGTTTTVTTFTVNGAQGSVITLDTVSGAGTFTIAKAGGGFVGVKSFSITRSTASPVNTWYADSNSTNGGSNTNWIFGDTITVDCRQYIDYFITRNKRNYFLVVPGVQFIFNPDNETDANDDFTDTGQIADTTKASLRTHIKLFTF